MRALTRLADKNQDRATYDMTFTFTSDQDDTFRKVIRLNKDNWFDLQRFQVDFCLHQFFIFFVAAAKIAGGQSVEIITEAKIKFEKL